MVESLVGILLEKYLTPYFSNFSRQNFKMSLRKGEGSMENLIFDEKITGRLPFPLKIKFGRLGNLTIKIPSYVYIASQGLVIEIKDVFLCFEMLEVKNWSEETVISKYQAEKKHHLKVFEDNIDIVYE